MCNLARIWPLLAVITGTAVTGCSLDDDRDDADADVPVSEDVLEIGVADLPAPGSIGTPIEGYAAYDSSIDSVSTCSSATYMRPGTQAFSTYLARFGITGNNYESCQTGFHPRGMALDVFISGTTGKQQFANWLTANNGEMARRLGLVQIIWQTSMWRSYTGGAGPQGAWGSYGGTPHTDHVHISFGELGAQGATSFFRDVINGGGGGGGGAAPTISPSDGAPGADFEYISPGGSYTCPFGTFCGGVWDPSFGKYKVFKLYYCHTYTLSNWFGAGFFWNNQTSGTTAVFYGQSGNVLTSFVPGGQLSYNWDPVWFIKNC